MERSRDEIKITSVKYDKKYKSYAIYSDGEMILGIIDDTLLYFTEIFAGNTIERKLVTEIIKYDQRARAYRDATAQLMRGMKTEIELKRKLVKMTYTDDAIDFAISKCKDNGYLNDEEYIRAYVERYASTRGAIRMKYELKQKGVDERLLKDICDDKESARELAVKFYNKKSDDPKVKEKYIRYMMSKGFEYDTAMRIYDEVKDNVDGVDEK